MKYITVNVYGYVPVFGEVIVPVDDSITSVNDIDADKLLEMAEDMIDKNEIIWDWDEVPSGVVDDVKIVDDDVYATAELFDEDTAIKIAEETL